MTRRFRIISGNRNGRGGRKAPLSRRLKQIPLRRLFPSLITILAICIGFTGLRFALEGRFEAATLSLLAAGLLDLLDGRIARMLRETSRFGAEIDSFADFLNFGVVAALILYHWGLHQLGGLGWMIAMFYVVCCALRLARFNAQSEDDSLANRHNYFIGVSAPTAAMIIGLPLYLNFLGWLPAPTAALPVTLLTSAIMIASAAFMISNLPTFSHKMFGQRIQRSFVVLFILGTALGVAFLINFPWHVMTAATLIYILSLPVSWLKFRAIREKEIAATGEKDTPDPSSMFGDQGGA